jgi:hypothetical protein
VVLIEAHGFTLLVKFVNDPSFHRLPMVKSLKIGVILVLLEKALL